jgi:hypothetical protein
MLAFGWHYNRFVFDSVVALERGCISHVGLKLKRVACAVVTDTVGVDQLRQQQSTAAAARSSLDG